MDNWSKASAIFGGLQLLFAVLVFFGIDAKTVSGSMTRDRFVILLIASGAVFSVYSIYRVFGPTLGVVVAFGTAIGAIIGGSLAGYAWKYYSEPAPNNTAAAVTEVTESVSSDRTRLAEQSTARKIPAKPSTPPKASSGLAKDTVAVPPRPPLAAGTSAARSTAEELPKVVDGQYKKLLDDIKVVTPGRDDVLTPSSERQRVPALSPPPSLLTLFMNDLRPKVGITWAAYFDRELADPKTPVRVFLNIYNDLVAHIYFAAFYVPEILINGAPSSAHSAEVISYIAENHKQRIDDIRSRYFAETKGAGDSRVESTADLTFSGRVYIYHEGSLTLEQHAALDKIFRERGVQPQFRGMDYVMAVWSSIRLGDVISPPKYTVRDNVPRLATETQ